MILKSIELENFMCYYGNNTFEFSEGINVIIGSNGYGKSKLFDAFYWVMYDQCYDSASEKFIQTNILKSRLISDKAKFETNDGKVLTSVVLNFHDIEKDTIYSIERRYQVSKINDEIIEDTSSQEIVSWKELSYLKAKIIDDPAKIQAIKNKILPNNIKPYMWFQGEQVKSIIDFNNSETLTQAINVLSNISLYDNIIKVADTLKDSSFSEFNRKQRSLSKDKDKSEELEIKRKKLVEKLIELEKDELAQQDQQSKAEEKAEELLNRIDDAQKIRDVDSRRKSIERSLDEVQLELNLEQISLHKKLFTNRWVLKGTLKIFDDYSKKYDTYEKTRLDRIIDIKSKLAVENAITKELQTRLPIDVPEPIHVERMLKKEHCLVCDREAPKNSEPWLKMKQLIDRSKLKLKKIEDEQIFVHDFSADFKKLYQNGLGLSHTIFNIDDDIKETFVKIQKLTSKRKSLSDDLTKIDNELKSMIAEASIDVNRATNLLNEYQSQNEYAKRFQKELSLTEFSKEKFKRELNTVNEAISDLVTGEIPKFLSEKVEILEQFQTVAQSTRDRVFRELVETLEKEANKHYQEMTSGNLSTRGIIKLKQLSNKNYMPELVDDSGKLLLGFNTGNYILIKLATIMAIISARKGSRDTDLYTLITDAPTSAFDEEYTIGFCKAVSNVYRQSIIMSYEFYKNEDLRRELLTSKEIKLGKVYMIAPNTPEDERKNRNSLTTNITPLN
jgi:DNA sulfur modification protein DndD